MAETIYATIDALRAKLGELRDIKQAYDLGKVLSDIGLTPEQKEQIKDRIATIKLELAKEIKDLKNQI